MLVTVAAWEIILFRLPLRVQFLSLSPEKARSLQTLTSLGMLSAHLVELRVLKAGVLLCQVNIHVLVLSRAVNLQEGLGGTL